MNKQPQPQLNTIRILQLNCNRSSNVINTILDLACNTADIVLLQEPGFHDPQYDTTHTNFILLKPPKGNRRYHRTATYIAKNHPYIRCTPRTDIINDPDFQLLEISTPLIPTFFLANIYNEYDNLRGNYTLPRTLPNIQLPQRCILSGNLNAHHSYWNPQTTTTKRADDIIHLLDDLNWQLCNIPDTPTYFYRQGTGTSVLDLT